jgi:hypothetical protein
VNAKVQIEKLIALNWTDRLMMSKKKLLIYTTEFKSKEKKPIALFDDVMCSA